MSFSQSELKLNSLRSLEQEKESLIQTIRALEINQEKILQENQELERALSKRFEHSTLLEGDKASLTEKIRQLQMQLMEFEVAHSSLLQEKANLKSSLAKLEGEKVSAEMRFNRSLENERENLNQTIRELEGEKVDAEMRFNRTLELEKENLYQAIRGLEINQERIMQENQELAIEVHKKSENLAVLEDENASLTEKIKQLQKQLMEFEIAQSNLHREKTSLKSTVVEREAEKVEVEMRLSEFQSSHEQDMIVCNKEIEQWKCSYFNLKKNSLTRILLGKANILWKKALNKYFNNWSRFSAKLRLLQGKTDLSIDFAAFSLKQSVFLEFKRLCQLSLMKRQYFYWVQKQYERKEQIKIINELKRISIQNKQKVNRINHVVCHWINKTQSNAFTIWKKETKESKSFNWIENILLNKDLEYNEKCLETTFTAWKLFTSQSKAERMLNDFTIEKEKHQEVRKLYSLEYDMKKQSKLIKICRNWKNQQLKKAFRTWTRNMKENLKKASEDTISTHISDKKAIRRELQAMKTKFESVIEEKNKEIITNINEKKKFKKIINFFLQKRAYDFSNEYSINKASYAFKKWKNRHNHYKRSFAVFSRYAKKVRYILGLSLIKEYSKNILKNQRTQEQLRKFFYGYGDHACKQAIASWRRNYHLKERENGNTEINNRANQIVEFKKQLYQIKKRNMKKSFTFLISKTKNEIFTAWFVIASELRNIKIATTKFRNKKNSMRTKLGFSYLLDNKIEKKIKNHKIQIIRRKVFLNLLRDIFGEWKNYHIEYRKFLKYVESTTISPVIKNPETEMDIITENEGLKRTLIQYNNFIKKEGHDPKELDNYLIENLRCEDIFYRWKLVGNYKTDKDLLENTFTLWKIWIIKRSKYKKFAERMMIYKKRGDELWALRTWKRSFSLFTKEVKQMNRNQLLDLLVKMDRDIATLKDAAIEKHKKLKYIESYCIELEEHVRRGQNQALIVCGFNIHSTLKRVLHNWNAKVSYLKFRDLYQKLTVLQEEYSHMKNQFKQLDMKNKVLLNENWDLRHTAMNGLTITDTIERIKIEKEKLSVDLNERNSMIEKLIEDKKDLEFKLRYSESKGFRKSNY